MDCHKNMKSDTKPAIARRCLIILRITYDFGQFRGYDGNLLKQHRSEGVLDCGSSSTQNAELDSAALCSIACKCVMISSSETCVPLFEFDSSFS